jgi:hypothetical protein
MLDVIFTYSLYTYNLYYGEDLHRLLPAIQSISFKILVQNQDTFSILEILLKVSLKHHKPKPSQIHFSTGHYMKVSLLFQKHHVYFFYFYGTAWEAFSYCLGPIACFSKHGLLLSFFVISFSHLQGKRFTLFISLRFLHKEDCPGQHRAPGGITMLFSIKVLYLTIDGTTINLYPLRLHIQHCEWL